MLPGIGGMTSPSAATLIPSATPLGKIPPTPVEGLNVAKPPVPVHPGMFDNAKHEGPGKQFTKSCSKPAFVIGTSTAKAGKTAAYTSVALIEIRRNIFPPSFRCVLGLALVSNKASTQVFPTWHHRYCP